MLLHSSTSLAYRSSYVGPDMPHAILSIHSFSIAFFRISRVWFLVWGFFSVYHFRALHTYLNHSNGSVLKYVQNSTFGIPYNFSVSPVTFSNTFSSVLYAWSKTFRDSRPLLSPLVLNHVSLSI